jgi:hypothetical protein
MSLNKMPHLLLSTQEYKWGISAVGLMVRRLDSYGPILPVSILFQNVLE